MDTTSYIEQSKTYNQVLDHRRKCNKWGKHYCLACFGGGLVKFTENLVNEGRNTKYPWRDMSTERHELETIYRSTKPPKFPQTVKDERNQDNP